MKKNRSRLKLSRQVIQTLTPIQLTAGNGGTYSAVFCTGSCNNTFCCGVVCTADCGMSTWCHTNACASNNANCA